MYGSEILILATSWDKWYPHSVYANHTTCYVDDTKIPNIVELSILSVSGLIINVLISEFLKPKCVMQFFDKTWWLVYATE